MKDSQQMDSNNYDATWHDTEKNYGSKNTQDPSGISWKLKDGCYSYRRGRHRQNDERKKLTS